MSISKNTSIQKSVEEPPSAINSDEMVNLNRTIPPANPNITIGSRSIFGYGVTQTFCREGYFPDYKGKCRRAVK